MLDLDFFKRKEAEPTAKLTIHKNAKAGFSAAANDLMNLADWKWCAFAKDRGESGGRHIYMMRMSEPSEVTFNVAKAGDYYYVKAKSLLDDLGIDYTDDSKRTIFDISSVENNGQTIYRLTKRVIKKRNKKAE